jgi:hypothetical protein
MLMPAGSSAELTRATFITPYLALTRISVPDWGCKENSRSLFRIVSFSAAATHCMISKPHKEVHKIVLP